MSKDHSVVTGRTRGGGKDTTHHYAPVNAAAFFVVPREGLIRPMTPCYTTHDKVFYQG